ncbi:MAG: hypothetical protein ACHQFZ_06570 [Acidimicrobiales bacterium]
MAKSSSPDLTFDQTKMKEKAVERRAYWPILVIGVLLIVMPFAISLPSKASAGQKMLDAFHPIMQPASVRESVLFYHNTFVPLGQVAVGAVAAAGETTQLFAGLAQGLHMTPAQTQAFMTKNYPAMAKLLASFPLMVPVFAQVGPGLTHYLPLVNTMQGQVKNYAAVDSLPNFNLFTWFFVVPGLLIVLFALMGLGLFQRRRIATSSPTPTGALSERELVGAGRP